MKYIDAEKLTKIIEERKTQQDQWINSYHDPINQGISQELTEILSIISSLQHEQSERDITEFEKALDNFGEAYSTLVDRDNNPNEGIRINAYHELVQEHISRILELAKEYAKQEQPKGLHFTPLNRLIQKISSENWNDTVNNYAKKLRDCLIKEGYRKDAEVLQGYISYMNGNNVPMATMDEQEQPEVDALVKMIWHKESDHPNNKHPYPVINPDGEMAFAYYDGIYGWQFDRDFPHSVNMMWLDIEMILPVKDND